MMTTESIDSCTTDGTDCIFCNIVNKSIDAHVVYQSDNIMAFLDIDPIHNGHVLIIPCKHYADWDELPDGVLYEIIRLASKLVRMMKNEWNAPGYAVMNNGGIFNDVGHFHLHLFPRYEKDGFGWTYPNIQADDLNIVCKRVKDCLDG
jgi:histidine triad (HIT) family protein